jgi:hypothetical protein
VGPLLSALASSRVERKLNRVRTRFSQKPDLDQVLYEETMRALGYLPNAESMLLLAKRATLAHIRDLDSSDNVLAVLLGASGLIPTRRDVARIDRSAWEYSVVIAERFEVLNAHLGISPLPREIWRFSRLRPTNAPELRIAQAAAIFSSQTSLGTEPLGRVVETLNTPRPVDALSRLFSARPDRFWTNHSGLRHRLKQPQSAALGAERVRTITVNAILPVALLSAHAENDGRMVQRLESLLDLLPPESDRITRAYSAQRGRPASARVTQGIHELYETRCRNQVCKDCPVGKHLSKQGCRFAP